MLETKESINILLAGDLIPPKSYSLLYSEKLIDILKNKDFSIVNLEAPLTLSNDKIKKTGNNYKSNPEAVKHLIDGYFDAVTLANNHIRDFGGQGVLATLEICQKNGIKTVGAGENSIEAAIPLIIEIKGKTFSIFNFCEREFSIATEVDPGANPFDLVDAYYQIKKLREKFDYIIVVYHGGLEYHHLPTPEIIKRFKYLIDIGADCVVSHHTHRYSGLITYKEKPIFYGLGNFYMPIKKNPTKEWLTGAIAKLIITSGGLNASIELIEVNDDYSLVDCITNDKRNKIIENITQISNIIDSEILLKKYWENAYSLDTYKLINLLKSSSLIEYRFRKHVLKKNGTFMTEFSLQNLLNIIRCDAHRERIIHILENKHKNS